MVVSAVGAQGRSPLPFGTIRVGEQDNRVEDGSAEREQKK